MTKPQKPDGGPAFPVIFDHSECVSEAPGMSLRDYFAAKALQGLLSCPSCGIPSTRITRICYDYADAMIEERSKK